MSAAFVTERKLHFSPAIFFYYYCGHAVYIYVFCSGILCLKQASRTAFIFKDLSSRLPASFSLFISSFMHPRLHHYIQQTHPIGGQTLGSRSWTQRKTIVGGVLPSGAARVSRDVLAHIYFHVCLFVCF